MDIEDILFSYNPWWQKQKFNTGIKRDKYLNILKEEIKNNKVTILLGIRRVGKSTMLHQIIKHLLTKINAKKILYVSMDHPELKNHSIGDILEIYRKMHQFSRQKKIYLIIDEIMHSESFIAWLKVLHDNENVKVFASSSSASLRDKKAFLTGRHHTIEIEPLDFLEFLKFRKSVPNTKNEIDKEFDTYMRMGGMPEYVLTNNPQCLIDLVDDIITKDIAAKHNIKNKERLKDMFTLLCERVGKRLTFSRLARILNMNKETISTYISYFVDTGIIYVLHKGMANPNERITAPKKIYIVDAGIRNIITGFKGKGSVFENIVFNINKKKISGYFEKNGIELDFVLENKHILECKYGKDLTLEQENLAKKYKATIAEGIEYIYPFNEINKKRGISPQTLFKRL